MAKTNPKRGMVVVARLPERDRYKVRPALIVQSDHNNARLTNVIVAMITSNTKLVGSEPAVVGIWPNLPEGASSGLHHFSAVKCDNLYTIPQSEIQRIGFLSDALMDQVNAGLRVSLGLA